MKSFKVIRRFHWVIDSLTDPITPLIVGSSVNTRETTPSLVRIIPCEQSDLVVVDMHFMTCLLLDERKQNVGCSKFESQQLSGCTSELDRNSLKVL